MAVDIILAVAGQGSGSGGESRQFAYTLIDPTPPLVTLSLDDVTGITSYLWEILNQPIGASSALSSQSAASPTFTPTATAWGTYLIRCVITRNGSQEVGTVALSFRTPNRDMRFPAAGEKIEFTAINGWMEAEHTLYEIVDNLSIGSGTGGTGDIGYWTRSSTRLSPVNSGDTLRVGSGNITYPSYAYEADTDTGRYLYNTGIEAFACSGNAQILFGSDGNPYIKAVDGHNILTIGNYKTVGGGEAELLIEADGNATTDGAIINFNAKSTSTKTSILNILSDSDNGITDLNLTSDCGDTGTTADIDILAYGGTATINITATRTGANSADINLDSNDDISVHASEIVSLTSGTNKASIVLYPTANGEIRFSDSYIYTNWANSYCPLSASSAESGQYTTTFGEISIFAALQYLHGLVGGAGTWDDVYDSGGAGAGRSSTVDNGAWTATVPVAGTNSAMSLSNLASGNTSEVLGIYNDASLSTGYAMYLQGDAGGSTSDYNAFGHRIWSLGSTTIGHGNTSDGAGNSRAYTQYHYRESDAISYAVTTMRADQGASWANYAYVRCAAATVPFISLATTGSIYMYDGYESGSTWTGSSMAFSGSSATWTSIQSLITAESAEQSLLGAILAASTSGGGVSEPDTQIVWGTGSGVNSDTYLTYEDTAHVLTLNGRLNLYNSAYGTPTSASFATNTITANFATGKDMQSVSLTADATSLSLTAPLGGSTKGLTLQIYAGGTSRTLGGTGFSSVAWEKNGPDLDTSGGAISMGPTDTVILSLYYDGSSWFGWVSEFTGGGL